MDDKEKTTHADSVRTSIRTEKETQALVRRLKLIEGQMRGIQRMVQKHASCEELIVQIASVSSALTGFNKALLTAHLKNSVQDDIWAGRGDEAIDEFADLFRLVMK